ncbi:hypothetical protein JOD57_000256 [Geodermatophilus bullaregiensis]|nr:hypothetical protein [Geodermatophilus bullaregiensis]
MTIAVRDPQEVLDVFAAGDAREDGSSCPDRAGSREVRP